MPRTAPTYTGTPTYTIVSYHFIDANGALATTPYITTPARATTAAIEAMAVALGAASNANLYDISVAAHTAANPSAGGATEEPRESANDVVNTLVREPTTRQTQEVVIPAPIDAMFIPGKNDVDPTNTVYQAVNVAADTLLPATYGFVSVRFSEHRKINQKTKF